jgi:hypothetical protein
VEGFRIFHDYPEITKVVVLEGLHGEGRCTVGWIVCKGGRESWNVWLEVSTGLVKLIAQAHA